jgi:hypothetical protein
MTRGTTIHCARIAAIAGVLANIKICDHMARRNVIKPDMRAPVTGGTRDILVLICGEVVISSEIDFIVPRRTMNALSEWRNSLQHTS